MKDVQFNPAEESSYECFNCGTVVRSTTQTRCPECGAGMRNRRTPIE
ncbi:rubrerythrin-like domain-containing protein [Natronolimnohabitans sp. A-GB9]|nr:rubrerythrin-like domain-containing protein [Natronolimnohabitans sp. A-GB9]MDQ2051272.1 rubrerythrin-like domain-containing protein [Natronolimnohabitans sp. A-GB9]